MLLMVPPVPALCLFFLLPFLRFLLLLVLKVGFLISGLVWALTLTSSYHRAVFIELAKQLIALVLRDPLFGLLMVSRADVDSDIDCDPTMQSQTLLRGRRRRLQHAGILSREVLQTRQVKNLVQAWTNSTRIDANQHGCAFCQLGLAAGFVEHMPRFNSLP